MGAGSRRAAIAGIMAVSVVVAGYSASGVIQLPSLDWINEGFTLYYVTSMEEMPRFNITISEVDGSDVTFDFWDTENGEVDVFFQTIVNSETREVHNSTDYYLDLFVNSDNVVDGQARFHRDTLPMIESTLDYHKFGNLDVTYFFHASKGYLTRLENVTTGDYIALDSTGTRTPTSDPTDNPWKVPPPILPPTCEVGKVYHMAGVHSGQVASWGALYFDSVSDLRGHWLMEANTLQGGVRGVAYGAAVERDDATSGGPGQSYSKTYTMVSGPYEISGGWCGRKMSKPSSINYAWTGSTITWHDYGALFSRTASSSTTCGESLQVWASASIEIKAKFSLTDPGAELSSKAEFGGSVTLSCSNGTSVTYDSDLVVGAKDEGMTLV